MQIDFFREFIIQHGKCSQLGNKFNQKAAKKIEKLVFGVIGFAWSSKENIYGAFMVEFCKYCLLTFIGISLRVTFRVFTVFLVYLKLTFIHFRYCCSWLSFSLGKVIGWQFLYETLGNWKSILCYLRLIYLAFY